MDCEPRLVLRVADECELLGNYGSTVRAALSRLHGQGASERELSALCDAASLPVLYYALQSLARRKQLSVVAMGENGPIATLAGSQDAADVQRFAVAPDTPHGISRFAFVRRNDEQLVIESPFSGAVVLIHDDRVLALFAQLATRRPLAEIDGWSASELASVAVLLLASGVLTADADEEALAYWRFADLLFHARSRYGRHRGGYGRTYRFRGRTAPLPALKPAMSGEPFALVKADLARLCIEDVPFTAVLEGRCTTRVFGEVPLHRRELGEFLHRVASHRRSVDDGSGQELAARPYPGAGALYELELYVSVAACEDLPAGFYHYHAGEHRLYKLPAPPHAVESLLRHAVQLPQTRPQVLFTIAARFARMFWSYDSIGYALILKDVGVLYQTMYLVAQAMGLGACALGGGDAEMFNVAAGVEPHAEAAVGELLLGSRGA